MTTPTKEPREATRGAASMTIREVYACHAMAGLLQHHGFIDDSHTVERMDKMAGQAFAAADAMLRSGEHTAEHAAEHKHR